MDKTYVNHEIAMIESSLFLNVDDQNEKTNKPNIKKDLKNIFFLMYLYLLQGVPLGLAASVPFILATRNVSYSDQATFSFAFYPFSIKLLWAPIVDAIYFRRIGRRKSWLIPTQISIGLFMICLANYSQYLVYNIESKYDVIALTSIFTLLTFLAATQDIALDGWAISMLSKENVSWQSTCNGVGQTAGYFIGNISIIVFESANFCNKYIRPFFNLQPQDKGIVSLEEFMYGFGAVFLFTSFIIVFKKEKDVTQEEANLSLLDSYLMIKKLLSLKSIQKISIILLTVKIGLSPENVSNLKLIEQGVSKEKLSLLSIPLVPYNILITIVVSKFIQKRPLISYMRAYPIRLFCCLLLALAIYLTPKFKNENGQVSLLFYGLLFGLYAIQTIFETATFISQMAFFASVADTVIGGTYMTLLATLSNLGGTYPGTIILYLINSLSKKMCSQTHSINQLNSTFIFNSNSTSSMNISYLFENNKCSMPSQLKECTEMGGSCATVFDAYYVLTIGFIIFGLIWLIVFRKLFISLSYLPKTKWSLTK